ncbi:MAG: Ig-like domain-containing protein [Bifidobacteriaceae bacterium]|jgi:alpha-tubulin suppressor-like RCC1 family protein|nr:Ig-like domain-containing protein [Bifidobacteriaceae bacterium]
MSFNTLTASLCALSVAGTALASALPADALPNPSEVQVSQMLAAGTSFAAVIDKDGHVWTWGFPDSTPFCSTSDHEPSPTPIRVPGITDAVSISAAHIRTVVATADGAVWNWGVNAHSALGTGMTPGSSYSAVPIQVPQLTDVVQVAAGSDYSLALTKSGQVYAWGSNTNHQLGDAQDQDSAIPVLVQGPTDVVSVSAGPNHAVALTSSGDVWTWGSNRFAELGTGSTDVQTVPLRVEGIAPMKVIAAGSNFTVTVDMSGDLWGWGGVTSLSSLGTGTFLGSRTPVRLMGRSDVVSVTAGSHTAAITASGDLWTWGNNGAGQLGTGDIVRGLAPARVDIPEPMVASAVSSYGTIALASSGKLYSWGSNSCFQLGDESPDPNAHPTQVDGVKDVISLDTSLGNTVVATADGNVWAWGDNTYHQLGDKRPGPVARPIRVPGLDGYTIKKVATGSNYMLGLATTGKVYGWGANGEGQLGNGKDNYSETPTLVKALPTNVIDIQASGGLSAAVTASGDLWMWGANSSGQLGRGNTSASSHTAAKVNGLPFIKAVALGGSCALAVSSAGEVWGWGSNFSNQLYPDFKVDRVLSPIPIPLSDTVESISTSGSHTLASMTSGGVLGWGSSFYGALGPDIDGSLGAPREIPGIDGHGTVYAGADKSMFLSDQGEVFTWGRGQYGQLGFPSLADTRTPTRVDAPPASTGAFATYHGALVSRDDATVYTWGRNSDGQLGYPLSGWMVTWRPTGLNLFDPPGSGVDPTPSAEPTDNPSVEPSQEPTGDPTEIPTERPTGEATSNPNDPADTVSRDPNLDSTPDDGGRASENDHRTTPPPGQVGPAPAPSGAPVAPPGQPAPAVPAISRFAASFATVIIRPGSAVKVPVATYRHATTPTGAVTITWTSSAPRIATVAGSKAKTGAWSWEAGTVKTVAIRAKKIGSTTVTLRSTDARKLVLRVRVVPRAEYRAVKSLTVRVAGGRPIPKAMAVGTTMWLKAIPHPIGAARVTAVWRSSNPSIARIDRAGLLTATGQGKATITCQVRGKTIKVAITVT